MANEVPYYVTEEPHIFSTNFTANKNYIAQNVGTRTVEYTNSAAIDVGTLESNISWFECKPGEWFKFDTMSSSDNVFTRAQYGPSELTVSDT